MEPRRARFRLTILVALAMLGAAAVAGVLGHRAYYVRKFDVVAPGKLYRSRQPEGLQWSVLKRHDIRTVINLRTRSEDPEALERERSRLAEAGVRFVHIPVEGHLPTYEQFERFVREVRADEGAVLVHCEHGRNRTGFMAAAYRIVTAGWTVEKAMQDIEDHGAHPKGEKRRKLVEMLTRIYSEREQWRDRTDPTPAGSSGPASRQVD
ncbi:MAG TPA: tyrosine-protein phosphatase [Phycisphaerae bacterium]|nr:tyrosine-protein phosphatase [Phycisphaerae bacterium]